MAFQLNDAMCPDFEQIMAQLAPDLRVSGEVVMLSDRGDQKVHFAIVNVSGISAPLIVPVHKLTPEALGKANVARHG